MVIISRCILPIDFIFQGRPGIDSSSTETIHCEKSIPLWNLFLETLIPCKGTEDFLNCSQMLCVGDGQLYWSTHFQQETIWQLSEEDEKSIPALKSPFYET
jgi:hypothetical protein